MTNDGKANNRFYKARTIYNKNGKESMRDVAEKLGIAKNTVYKLESRPLDCSYKTVVKLANHYGVSLKWLVGMSEIPYDEGKEIKIPNKILDSLCIASEKMFELSKYITETIIDDYVMKGELYEPEH